LFVVLLSQLQIEFSPGRVVLAWGDPPAQVRDDGPPVPADGRFAELLIAADRAHERAVRQEQRLADLAQRLETVDELARLATNELLAVENRHARELDRLRNALARSERTAQAALNELREQGDLRWKLTVHELSQRAAFASVVESPVAAQ
jgi:hypothetical protein